MIYLQHLLIMFCLYFILAESLNLVVGYGGMLSLCHAAFYGLGAYMTALLMVNARWPFFPALAAAAIGTSFLALLVALPCLRLRGHFFTLGTLGFQILLYTVLYNWISLTGGPYGLTGIPRPSIGGWPLRSGGVFLVLTSLVALGVFFVHWRLDHLPFARSLKAVRDDEVAARAVGKTPLRFRCTAFVIAGGGAAIAGGLYASYSAYIDPTSFTLDESIFLVTAVIVGGAGNLRGPGIGSIVVVLLPEMLRFLRLPDAAAANVRQIVFGLLLILMMRFRPQGLGGSYAFD